jgi:UDP-N-acetyl-D-mannosaminuronic acid transferase (WecB/TagA/CpsF family)
MPSPIEEIGADTVIGKINPNRAEFLAAALGAKKRANVATANHDDLQVPTGVHLDATINFQAGTIKRAPAALRLGLERCSASRRIRGFGRATGTTAPPCRNFGD